MTEQLTLATPSKTRQDITHLTALCADGSIRCTCEGWLLRKPDRYPRTCVHVDALIAVNGWHVGTDGEFVVIIYAPVERSVVVSSIIAGVVTRAHQQRKPK